MFATIEQAIEDLKAGKMVIVVDDENRENEGDFIMPAQTITSIDVNFMARYGRGLICAPISADCAKRLELNIMVPRSEDSLQTAFTVSVDAAQHTTTGISVRDRAVTLKLLADGNSKPADFIRPGHIFPLIAKDGGVLEREGHTEAAVDLSKMAGFAPVGVICEILTEDGSCARLPYLKELAQKFQLNIITIEDLIDYRKQHPRCLVQGEEKYANYQN